MGVETTAKAGAKKPDVHPNTWVYFQGEFARYHDVKLGLMTHALHYGTGCFEGIRAYWNARQEQLHGVIVAATAHGIDIALRGVHEGVTWRMPPMLEELSPARPGLYRLRSTGEAVEDPDFVFSLTVHAGQTH